MSNKCIKAQITIKPIDKTHDDYGLYINGHLIDRGFYSTVKVISDRIEEAKDIIRLTNKCVDWQ